MKLTRIMFTIGMALGLLTGVAVATQLNAGVWAQSDGTSPLPASAFVVQQVEGEVVTVINAQEFDDFVAAQPAGSGTGFIIDDLGHIVTNWHVVNGGDEFLVVFANGDRRDATLVGSDELSDLAVVKVEGELPGIVPFGDSDALHPGETVLAIGSPLGTFTNTVTQGIVSAIGRDFEGSGYNNLIQHDAAINPGNSGGPLFNMQGQVVGVNTLGFSEQNGQLVQGLFFAVPSSTVQAITERLIADGQVVYPFFGITYQTITWQRAGQAGLPVENGVLLTEITPGGPADFAGLRAGDIVLAINGVVIDEQDTFSELLFEHLPGDQISVDVLRSNEQFAVTLLLADRALFIS
ncbi:trypsin-like peptidase domain-containing protein [soil metagenome]